MIRIIFFLFFLLNSLFVSASDQDPKLIKIAIVDTGLDVEDPRFENHICGYKDFTGQGITDLEGHGTHVAGLIKQYAKDNYYCFIILKYYTEKQNGTSNQDKFVKCLEFAAELKVDIVNISGGGTEFEEREYLVIKNNPKILFVSAAGNDNKNIDLSENYFYPASYSKWFKNVIVVGSLSKIFDNIGFKAQSSNYGKIVKNWEIGNHVLSTLPNDKVGYMSGTSMATAIHTGKLIK